MCESQGGRPGLPVPNSPYGLCGRKATFNLKLETLRAQELCESQGGRPGLPVPNSPYGLCGRKAILNLSMKMAAATHFLCWIALRCDSQTTNAMILRFNEERHNHMHADTHRHTHTHTHTHTHLLTHINIHTTPCMDQRTNCRCI